MTEQRVPYAETEGALPAIAETPPFREPQLATEERLAYVLVDVARRRPHAVYSALEAAAAEIGQPVSHLHAFSDTQWVWGWWEVWVVPMKGADA